MQNIKIVILALFICMLFINADCNKVDEKPVDNGYTIEGRIVNSCTDNTPLRNINISIAPKIYVKNLEIISTTDSNGYFKIKISQPMGLMTLNFENAQILGNIPSSKNLNLGNVVISNFLTFKLIYNNFSKLKNDDSIIVYTQNGFLMNSKSDLTIKGPFTSGYIQTLKFKAGAIFEGDTSIKGKVQLYRNNFNNLLSEKNFFFTNCGAEQEIIFR